jgi:hypothetical protein
MTMHEQVRRGVLGSREGSHVLHVVAAILLVAWLLGVSGIYFIGPSVHLLLVFAVVLFLGGLVSARPVGG